LAHQLCFLTILQETASLLYPFAITNRFIIFTQILAGEMIMQILDPLDPTMLLLYGIIITSIFLLYAMRVRRSNYEGPNHDNISTLAGSRIEEITTGAVQESMPAHLVSIEEERREHEGENP
jgi:hypothetical protein